MFNKNFISVAILLYSLAITAFCITFHGKNTVGKEEVVSEQTNLTEEIYGPRSCTDEYIRCSVYGEGM